VRLDTRYQFPEDLQVQVNGEWAKLCDLSTSGCQIVSTAPLRPNQLVKLLLPFDDAFIPCNGAVVWARVEPAETEAAQGCRAGLRLLRPDEAAIEAFVIRYAIPT
jgi:hypothetical protein